MSPGLPFAVIQRDSYSNVCALRWAEFSMFVLAHVPRVFHTSESACAALRCCNKTLPFLDSIVLSPRLPSVHTDTPAGIGQFPTAHFHNKSRTVTGIEKIK